MMIHSILNLCIILQLITSMTGGTLNRRNTISVGEDPSMVSGQSLTFDHDV